jgi:hypothetical protein
MKAIGKGSLASFLAIFLHVTRVVLWLGFAGATVALIAIPIIPSLVEFAFKGGEAVNGDVSLEAGLPEFIEAASYFVTFGVMLYVVERLLEVLKELRFGSPFVRDNANRFKQIGFALLFGEIAKFSFGILGAIFDADVNWSPDAITIGAICAVFVIAEVFSEGARMKEEQDLTV